MACEIEFWINLVVVTLIIILQQDVAFFHFVLYLQVECKDRKLILRDATVTTPVFLLLLWIDVPQVKDDASFAVWSLETYAPVQV